MTSSNEIEKYFQFFGFDSSASFDEVKEARKRYLKAFHPDRFDRGSKDAEFFDRKMIELNAAFEELTKWFEDPARNEKEADAAQSEASQGNSATGFDENSPQWASWQTRQEKLWADEYAAWQKEQSSADRERRKSQDMEARKQLVLRAKISAAAILVLLWIGHASNQEWLKTQRLREAQGIISATQYDLQTHGTANSAYWQSDDRIGQKWMYRAAATGERWKEEDQQHNLGLAGLALLSLASCWGFFSSRANRMVDGWIAKGEI